LLWATTFLISLCVIISSSDKDTNHIKSGHILVTSFLISYFLKLLSPNTVTFCGIWSWVFNIHIWERGETFQYNTGRGPCLLRFPYLNLFLLPESFTEF
jgi:hypothetical protein